MMREKSKQILNIRNRSKMVNENSKHKNMEENDDRYNKIWFYREI